MSDVITRLVVKDGDLYVQTWQDVEDIIEENKTLQNEKQTGDFRKTASIPTNLLNVWLNELIARGANEKELTWNSPEFWEYINKKILRDPDWSKLRCQG